MLKRCLIGIIIVVSLVATVIVAYNNFKTSASKDDITVEATLQINNTTNNSYKEYNGGN